MKNPVNLSFFLFFFVLVKLNLLLLNEESLILIVFIENCFKHSTSSQTDNIQINIDIAIQNNRLIMECSNTFSPWSVVI